jgi:HD-GYP domain-containing protein (c-di-GMP phosphodiesterase class II)
MHGDNRTSREKYSTKRAALHYFLTVIVLSVYGGQVCPYIEGLDIGYWLVSLGGFFAAALVLRHLVMIGFLPHTAFLQMPGKQFFIELSIFLAASVAITLFNMSVHHFPFGSGMKIIVGSVSLGFFAAGDLALERERRIYEYFTVSGLSIVPKKRYFPLTTKFLILSTALIAMITAIIFLVISKDLEWLGDLGYTDPARAQLAVLGELAFIAAVMLGGTINLIHSYARNLRLFLENENSSLRAVSEGVLTRPAVVSTNDEFGVMAHYTNRMIDELRLRIEEIQKTQDAAIISLASLAEIRDIETGMHILRTKLYVKALAEKLSTHPEHRDELTPETIELMHKSAPLHDIGKVGIPDSVLLKPARLTPEEFDVMKLHPVYGGDSLGEAEKALGESSFLNIARQIAYTHHEKWDGSGYPRGLSGKAIPLPGRLMALADVYDALAFKRVYKPAIPHEETRNIIMEDRGKQFDPDVVDAFLAVEDRFLQIVAEHSGE